MRQHRVWAAALLGAAALLLAPATSQAQVSIGAGRFGVGVGTPYYSPGYSGYGNYPNYGYSNYGYSGYGNSPSRWTYSSPWYGGYNYSPNYYSSGSSWSYPSSGYYSGSSWSYPSSGYYSGSSWSYPSYGYSSAGYYSMPAASGGYYSPADTDSNYTYGAISSVPANCARINVRLPDADAQVWFDDTQTRQRGTMREFASPSLEPDTKYTYEVRARWTENGKPMESKKTISVRANGTATVDFTAGNSSRLEEIDRDRPRTDIDRRGTDLDRPKTDLDRDRRGTDLDRPKTDPDRDRPRPNVDRDRPKTESPRPGDTRPPSDVKPPDRP